MKKLCMTAMTMLVITGCSDKTTTQESKQEENTVSQHSQHEEDTTKQNVEKKEANTQSNIDFLKQYEGYWKSEDGSTFVEIKNEPDNPLYIIHNQDGTKKEFSLQVDTKNEQEKELKGTITAIGETTETTYQSIDIKLSDQKKLIINTNQPVTFAPSTEADYNESVQHNKEQANSEESTKNESLDKTLQLLNGTWKSTDNAETITISVDNANSGTFQWEGQEPVNFVINENTNGEVDIVYESVASQSHRMIEWTWIPTEKQLTAKSLINTLVYKRIQ
ncbi:hypothetical protein [Priestia megaterium]|uniref:hypothetical protein n=1 Tax=Priestia megaterium TaxID=1404 RepID=UPI0029FA4FDA|nr:hypothetical protein [Bacillus sp. ET1]